jgi:hypothetical protein
MPFLNFIYIFKIHQNTQISEKFRQTGKEQNKKTTLKTFQSIAFKKKAHGRQI